jgi:sec-independent protein translocase protein TatB
MFDIGWSEMLVIAIVTIIFIGPKELPGVLREVGRWIRRVQSMAAEFRGHVDDMVRDSEVNELRQQVEHFKNINLEAEVKKAVDPAGELNGAFDVPDLNQPAPSILPPASPGTADPTLGSAPASADGPGLAAAEADISADKIAKP